jgi:hypothetical protein
MANRAAAIYTGVAVIGREKRGRGIVPTTSVDYLSGVVKMHRSVQRCVTSSM